MKALRTLSILMIAAMVLFAAGCSKSSASNDVNPGNNGGGNSGGNNNGGGNGGGSGYVFPDDFEFIYGFENFGVAYKPEDDYYGYERIVPLHLGYEQSNLMSLGVQEIAIGIVCLDGNIYYDRPHWDNGMYIKKENNIIWYTIYPNNTAQNWTTFLIFEHQSTTTTRFKWTSRAKYNGVYYFEGERWKTENIPSN